MIILLQKLLISSCIISRLLTFVKVVIHPPQKNKLNNQLYISSLISTIIETWNSYAHQKNTPIIWWHFVNELRIATCHCRTLLIKNICLQKNSNLKVNIYHFKSLSTKTKSDKFFFLPFFFYLRTQILIKLIIDKLIVFES